MLYFQVHRLSSHVTIWLLSLPVNLKFSDILFFISKISICFFCYCLCLWYFPPFPFWAYVMPYNIITAILKSLSSDSNIRIFLASLSIDWLFSWARVTFSCFSVYQVTFYCILDIVDVTFWSLWILLYSSGELLFVSWTLTAKTFS